jgi:hypothetical protein
MKLPRSTTPFARRSRRRVRATAEGRPRDVSHQIAAECVEARSLCGNRQRSLWTRTLMTCDPLEIRTKMPSNLTRSKRRAEAETLPMPERQGRDIADPASSSTFPFDPSNGDRDRKSLDFLQDAVYRRATPVLNHRLRVSQRPNLDKTRPGNVHLRRGEVSTILRRRHHLSLIGRIGLPPSDERRVSKP